MSNQFEFALLFNQDEYTFLLTLAGVLIVAIALFTWLTEPDPYDDEDLIYNDLAPKTQDTTSCDGSGKCQFGEDVGMPEYRCKDKCQYEIFRTGK